MKEFLTYILTNIAKNADSVVVDEVLEGSTYNYKITVHPDDMGLVIGKEGRTIKSIRSLAKAKAIKEGIMINVELLEPDGSERSFGPPSDEAAPAPTEELDAPAEEVLEETSEEAVAEVPEDTSDDLA